MLHIQTVQNNVDDNKILTSSAIILDWTTTNSRIHNSGKPKITEPISIPDKNEQERQTAIRTELQFHSNILTINNFQRFQGRIKTRLNPLKPATLNDEKTKCEW